MKLSVNADTVNITRLSEKLNRVDISGIQKSDLLSELTELFTLKEILKDFEIDFVEKTLKELKNDL